MDYSDGPSGEPPTAGLEYAQRLQRLSTRGWKRMLDVQAPYRWNLRRRLDGRILDVGCGTGRNLAHLSAESVGVDHNPHSIGVCRDRGLTAFTVEEFFADEDAHAPASYDGLLAAHLIEHLPAEDATEILASYLPAIKPGGTIMFITPQERGYASDSTHVAFTDFDALRQIADDLGLRETQRYSFPFPRVVGRVFTHNEFNFLAENPR
ncbi:methyltransferase domain-containing protein [Aeromicrobium sp. 636]|uniref:Class I SAM-dependent methyltransferase n=1 Tax=Aeromicrobium senzhongii TaxID=2663859 RepID=A0A8I0EWZ4_9ACTN|nr:MULTISPECIES: class I SAM-dependent methyltransferase [Aeromicrobium]MBC9227178.1 class I SAM-dependent methyltransferase [Aeromicrobium senzhongii]MCQ3999277.1 methyltransferase domain-containing protein [Aeromicrobium sp. 636]MTB88410.1 methyltransferase domain-containing protein [Aeromicrobium senzhongii]QNL94624.1 class I SAM-dependent methyltransferase [Aeromicrobium senzhongii]